MTSDWAEALALLGVQHLWQSAVLLPLVWLVSRLQRQLGAEARSWILLCAFALAVVSPLAIFLPGDERIPVAAAPENGVVEERLVTRSPGRNSGLTPMAVAGKSVLGDILPGLKYTAMLVWLLGTAWGLTYLSVAWYRARRLLGGAEAAPRLERLLTPELGVNVAIKVSDRITSPMVVGLPCQCILVPKRLAAELPESVLLDLLYHEIAHVRRYDLWVSFAQQCLLAIYWWSPCLRFIGTRLNLNREMACDERAAQSTGGSRKYARSLLAGVEKALGAGDHRYPLATASFDDRGALAQRIGELVSMDTRARGSGRKPALLLCAAMLAACAALALAATPRTNGTIAQDESMPFDEAELLVEAAMAGRREAVRRLVQGGVNVDTRVEGYGTALIQAAKAGDLPMVDELLRMDAQVDRFSLRDGNPLIMASMGGHLDIVQRLVAAGADINAVVPYDETPLINAAREGHLTIVRYLVEHGADVNLGSVADRGQWRSPLNQARTRKVREYLSSQGAVADIR